MKFNLKDYNLSGCLQYLFPPSDLSSVCFFYQTDLTDHRFQTCSQFIPYVANTAITITSIISSSSRCACARDADSQRATPRCSTVTGNTAQDRIRQPPAILERPTLRHNDDLCFRRRLCVATTSAPNVRS